MLITRRLSLVALALGVCFTTGFGQTESNGTLAPDADCLRSPGDCFGCNGVKCYKDKGCKDKTTLTACYACCTDDCQDCATTCQDKCDGQALAVLAGAGVSLEDTDALIAWLASTDFFETDVVEVMHADTIAYLYLNADDDRVIRWAVALASLQLYRENRAETGMGVDEYEQIRQVLHWAITDERSAKVRIAAARAVGEAELHRFDREVMRTVIEAAMFDDDARVRRAYTDLFTDF